MIRERKVRAKIILQIIMFSRRYLQNVGFRTAEYCEESDSDALTNLTQTLASCLYNIVLNSIKIRVGKLCAESDSALSNTAQREGRANGNRQGFMKKWRSKVRGPAF